MVKIGMAAQEGSSSSKRECFFNIDSEYKITTKITTFPLNGRNYSTWVTNATRALLGMRVLGFVDGEIQQPKVGEKEYAEWRYVDNLVITWIINSIDQSLVGAFNKAKTAKDLWNALGRRFGNHGNLLKIYELREIITNAKMHGSDFLSYSNKIKEAWDELECLRPITTNEEELEKRANEDLVCFLLAGLGSNFGDLRNQILRNKEMPPYDDVVNMVDKELMAREAFDKDEPKIEKGALVEIKEEAMVTQGVKESKIMKCERCGRPGHIKRNCRFCDHCGKFGHNKDKCFELHPHLRKENKAL